MHSILERKERKYTYEVCTQMFRTSVFNSSINKRDNLYIHENMNDVKKYKNFSPTFNLKLAC